MLIKTGETVYEAIRSWEVSTNNPVFPATFNPTMYKDGNIYSAITIDISVIDSSNGMYNISWSASTFGTYQLHIENETTNVIYVSEIYNVKPDSEVNPSPTIYVGL
jgi:tellurite resistance protein TehA-like permease